MLTQQLTFIDIATAMRNSGKPMTRHNIAEAAARWRKRKPLPRDWHRDCMRVTLRLRTMMKYGLIERLPERLHTRRVGQPPFLYRLTDDGAAWLERERELLKDPK